MTTRFINCPICDRLLIFGATCTCGTNTNHTTTPTPPTTAPREDASDE